MAKYIDILNDKKYIKYRDTFRRNCKQGNYASTEIAFIHRYLDGERRLKGQFSKRNLELIKMLRRKK